MNTSASLAVNTLAWKQEVNQRLAAHKRRSGNSTEPQAPLEDQHATGNRSAEVAARVAARYAHAPSYSEMLTGEARAAVRAAEAASRAALEAQAAAESVLAELEAASEAEATQTRAAHGQRIFEISFPDKRESYECANDGPAVFDGIEVAEAALPAHANLIEFPVEFDMARKVRPRWAERRYEAEGEFERQLSIFGVAPGSILIQPEPVEAVAHAAVTAWTGSEWLGIELDEEPLLEEIESQAGTAAPALQPASINRRVMAAVVDGTLTAGACVAAALVATVYAHDLLLGPRQIELGAAVALVVIGVFYQALFFALGKNTPGMKYAGISMCTFNDQIPRRVQRLGRLGALLLSLLPVGLGVAWALFDEENLGWHDRLSRSYLRKG